MTQYAQTVGKSTDWQNRQRPQTGLLPALPAAGAILSYAGTATTALTAGGLLAKATKAGKTAKSAAKTGTKAAGNPGVVNIAKAGVTGYALHEFNKVMSSGPTVGGVDIVPAGVMAASTIVNGKMIMEGQFKPIIMLPTMGAGILAAYSQFKK